MCFVSIHVVHLYCSIDTATACRKSHFILLDRSDFHIIDMTNADYVDILGLVANTPAQAKSLLLNLEQTTGGIGLYVNANKTEFMCIKQKGTISTLSGKPLKLVDQFTYLSSNISSTESNVNNIHIYTGIYTYIHIYIYIHIII